ncbi:unannotated protein [freshwater metagenome]|jgi:hypothetical protein|uniref:Unannotated protein n=1 Tax=freshwater metagenome TaxID=449393 RepID=A0A6J6K957_9ZZZZ
MHRLQLQLADHGHHHCREIRDVTVNLCQMCGRHGGRALGLDGTHESLALGVMHFVEDVAALTKDHAKQLDGVVRRSGRFRSRCVLHDVVAKLAAVYLDQTCANRQ